MMCCIAKYGQERRKFDREGDTVNTKRDLDLIGCERAANNKPKDSRMTSTSQLRSCELTRLNKANI